MTKKKTRPREDIVDALTARGDPLSLRAARYIRIKRTRLEGVEIVYRKLCAKLLLEERHGRR